MNKYILIALAAIFVTACTSQAPTVLPAPSLTPNTSALTGMPMVTPTIEPCAYVQANQSLPDVTAQIDAAIKQLQPEASGRAEAYGENCVYASTGQSTFSAMETDFYFTVNVNDLTDNNELGTWIVNTMKIVEDLPPDSITGPQAGFVAFTFKSQSNQKTLRVPISSYKNLPANISPVDIIPTLFPNQ